MKKDKIVTIEEIREIIEKVARSQVYDRVRPQERSELVNEAWVAVLEELQKQGELAGYQVYGIARHRLIQWKTRMRSALNIPLNSWYATKYMGRDKRPVDRTYIGCELKDWFVEAGWKDRERKIDFNMMVERVEKKLGKVERFVLREILAGGTIKDAWEKLVPLNIPYCKRRAYEAPEKIKKVWIKELEGGENV